MCALAHVREKHYDAKTRIAPAMRPSRYNKVQAVDTVTPDMVSQGKGVDLVVEVKRSLPGSKGGRCAALDQIAKYDDDLSGWTRSPRRHDIMLMTHMSKSSRWADFLSEAVKKKRVAFRRKVSVVEYVRDSERETYFILKNVWGETRNAALNRHLHNGIVVRGEQITKKMDVQFCDSKPDVAYTMSVLWDQIFPVLIAENKHHGSRGREAVDHAVDLAGIMGKMRVSTKSLSCPPRQPWIAEALEAFVRLRMAERLPDGRFLVHYKSVRGDLVKFFVKRLVVAGSRPPQG